MAHHCQTLSLQLCLLTFTILLPCSLSAKPTVKIIGGENATEAEFPFVVSLQMKPPFGDRYHYCGGSILTATHVVTTASCVAHRKPHQIEVLAGAFNLTVPEEPMSQRRNLSSITLHPEFNSYSIKNDIALLKLNEPFQFTTHVQPMLLPSPFPPKLEYIGNCTVLGWGSSLIPPSSSPQVLQKLNMTLVSLPTCSSNYEFLMEIDTTNGTMICAKGTQDEKTQGPCTGDLGSPLVCNQLINPSSNLTVPVVAGIVAWSMIPCGNSGYPSVYTNITTLKSFSVELN